jgi:hypothetical protein
MECVDISGAVEHATVIVPKTDVAVSPSGTQMGQSQKIIIVT